MKRFLIFALLLPFPYALKGESAGSGVLDTLHRLMLSDSAGRDIDSLGTAKKMEEACILSERVGNEAGILLSCGVLSFQKAADREYSKADSIYGRLMEVLKSVGLPDDKKREYVWRMSDMLAFANSETGNYKEAIRYYTLALKNYSSTYGDTLYLPYVYNRMGMVYHRSKRYGKAEEYYKKAIKLSKGEMAARVYNNLGMLYHERMEYGKAIKYLKEAERLLKESLGERAKQLAYVYNNLADVYNAKGDSAKAREYREKARGIERP